MKIDAPITPSVWRKFEKVARRGKRDPKRVVSKLIREWLEIEEDRQLFEAMRKAAQKSGLQEEDAVEIVRQYRASKRERRAHA
jgi:hypothetical protein